MPDSFQDARLAPESASTITAASGDPATRCRDLEHRLTELGAAVEQAEYANRTKAAFLAMISHELRTPLNAILGFSELGGVLRSDAPETPSKLATYMGHIHEAASHLARLINRVLDLSKIEAGRMDIAPQNLDLSESLTGALSMVSEPAAAAGVRLDQSADAGLETLWADEQMLTEMLLNLVSNAIKFTPPGGTVSLSATAAGDGSVMLTVTDTGRGIPADKIDSVFTPYEQIDNLYRRGLSGTGLGLSLVRAMMTLHRGRIVITSTEGQGTSVGLWFPPPPHAPPGLCPRKTSVGATESRWPWLG
jgi:signal transduction histidine kinase